MTELSYASLRVLVTTDGVAIRVRQRLQPAGGAGDKVFPPTYGTGDRTLKYAVESRRIEGRDVPCVLLDSVASQANRIEEALLDAWEQRVLDFPVIGVDFGKEEQLQDVGVVTTLQAPHRIADAILRDSVDADDQSFRETALGKAYTNATSRNATAVFQLCPTALIFGVWDSTGAKGGMGAKFQRALTSEIVALGASAGKKVSSRIDPLGIQANVPVYHRAEDHSDWTIDASEAEVDKKGKPLPFNRSGGEGKGKASSVNHSNIAPSIDEFAGGVTFDYAVQTVVLSLAALRGLRFVTDLDGVVLTEPTRAQDAARSALAALAIAGIVHQRARGYDLRSRCLLVPDGPLVLEVVRADGRVDEATLTTQEANALVAEAATDAAGAGLAWTREPIRLRPAAKLADLLRRSRELAAGGDEDEAA